MTPKKKAFELKYKYSKLLDLKSTDELVLKCALILVSEMKKQCWDYRDIDIQLSYDYWVQVEQEILKLCSK
jgi:hypothetical protein